ncbi:MAG: porin family protein [Holosporales bacterium]|nr:porin family protein [Holosporales bacterium]
MVKVGKVLAVTALATVLVAQEHAVSGFNVGVSGGVNKTQYKFGGSYNRNTVGLKAKKARFIAAIDLGYDVPFCDVWLAGIEARAGITVGKIKKSQTIAGVVANMTVKSAPFGALLLRGGYSVYQGGVLYAVFGPQLTKHKVQIAIPALRESVARSKKKVQFLGGLGFRHEFADWFIKLEYDHAFRKKVYTIDGINVKNSSHIFQLGVGWKA